MNASIVQCLLVIGIFVASAVVSAESQKLRLSTKSGKKEKKYRYIIYHIKDGKESGIGKDQLSSTQDQQGQKMIYGSSYDALKEALVGIYKYVQANDFEEASQEAIEDAFRKGGK